MHIINFWFAIKIPFVFSLMFQFQFLVFVPQSQVPTGSNSFNKLKCEYMSILCKALISWGDENINIERLNQKDIL